ncbi:MAG: DUF3549 family protein [Gammaproteobacteria bacterium]|nr:DUF3549 family protein [Gammaproteobacteria bacterium]
MNNQLNVTTLLEFLESTGAHLRFIDMGRRITPIAREDFLGFEKADIPYPLPVQQQAWIALLFENPVQCTDPYVWFLRFPLDEQGKLVQSTRDDFMHQLLERIGANLEKVKQEGGIENSIGKNPYSFEPRDDRRAIFYATASKLLQVKKSKYYSHARDYFNNTLGWDQWPFVGFQGIADLAARIDEADNEAIVTRAIPLLPFRPLEALCHCLENQVLPPTVAQALSARAMENLSLESPDNLVTAAIVRGVSRSETHCKKLLLQVLSLPCGDDPTILSAIGGRAWECLTDEAISKPFLQRLAENSGGQEVFNQCLMDLMFLPGMRQPLLNVLRDPERTTELSRSVGSFFQHVAGHTSTG